jgi:hypothetical protein
VWDGGGFAMLEGYGPLPDDGNASLGIVEGACAATAMASAHGNSGRAGSNE